jgi:hypothetical protein
MIDAKAIEAVNGLLKKGGWPELDGRHMSLLRRGNATLAVAAVPGRDLFLVSSPVISLPEENLLPLFRKLLTLNLAETQDAAFALNEEAGTIDLQIKRPLRDLDQAEFDRAVNSLAVLADKYNDQLAGQFGSEAIQERAPKAEKWKSYMRALNPVTTIVRREDLRGRVRRVRAVFSVLGLLAAIGAAIFAHDRFGSWALAIFALLWVQYIIARIIPDLITEPDRIRRFLFFALYPALAVGLLLVTHGWWGKWWLSALIGYLGGTFLARLVGILIMPRISLEEFQDDQERIRGWRGAQSGVA